MVSKAVKYWEEKASKCSQPTSYLTLTFPSKEPRLQSKNTALPLSASALHDHEKVFGR